MTKTLNLAIAADHAGFEFKERIKDILKEQGHEVHDYGTNSGESVDYPDYVHPLAANIGKGKYDFGILLCGSANGVAMTANKHQHVRAAIAWHEDVATLARRHNNANIVCLPARLLSLEECTACLAAFLSTPFEGGRHGRRVDKIACLTEA